jgi:hypothetical protein
MPKPNPRLGDGLAVDLGRHDPLIGAVRSHLHFL